MRAPTDAQVAAELEKRMRLLKMKCGCQIELMKLTPSAATKYQVRCVRHCGAISGRACPEHSAFVPIMFLDQSEWDALDAYE